MCRMLYLEISKICNTAWDSITIPRDVAWLITTITMYDCIDISYCCVLESVEVLLSMTLDSVREVGPVSTTAVGWPPIDHTYRAAILGDISHGI